MPAFSPSLRLKEPQTKLTSLIPPERLQEIILGRIFGAATPHRALDLSIVSECYVGAFGAFLALKLSRSQPLWQGAGAVHSQHLSHHVDGARRTPKII